MRQWVILGALGFVVVACGGTSSLGTKDGNSEESGGGANETGGDGNAAGGKSAGGGTASGGDSAGGKYGTGGVAIGGNPGTGGQTGGECKSAAECAVPATCKQCPDGTFSCAKGDCVAGQCVVEFPECSGGTMCNSNADCPPAPPSCTQCDDGTEVCASVDCVNGQCVGNKGTCGTTPSCDPAKCPAPADGNGKACCLSDTGRCGVDTGNGCTSTPGECTVDRDCPALPLPCNPCSDGTCQKGANRCVAGKCTLEWEQCGGLSWYITCGDPICKAPPPDGAGGAADLPIPALPPCDPSAGQKQGGPCKEQGAMCDPGYACGEKLVCTTSDPTNGGKCPL